MIESLWLCSLRSIWQVRAAGGTACPECRNSVGWFVFVQLCLQDETVEGFGQLLVSRRGHVAWFGVAVVPVPKSHWWVTGQYLLRSWWCLFVAAVAQMVWLSAVRQSVVVGVVGAEFGSGTQQIGQPESG